MCQEHLHFNGVKWANFQCNPSKTLRMLAIRHTTHQSTGWLPNEDSLNYDVPRPCLQGYKEQWINVIIKHLKCLSIKDLHFLKAEFTFTVWALCLPVWQCRSKSQVEQALGKWQLAILSHSCRQNSRMSLEYSSQILSPLFALKPSESECWKYRDEVEKSFLSCKHGDTVLELFNLCNVFSNKELWTLQWNSATKGNKRNKATQYCTCCKGNSITKDSDWKSNKRM